MKQDALRKSRLYKALHKPMTYMGVDRKVFFFVAVLAVATFNLFNSLLAGFVMFLGGYLIGLWITNEDPAFIRILASAHRTAPRYDAAKQQRPNVEIK